MTKPREQQISLEATPYYHCYVRCVGRANIENTLHESDFTSIQQRLHDYSKESTLEGSADAE